MQVRAPVAQWIERSRPKAGVGGSNPSGAPAPAQPVILGEFGGLSRIAKSPPGSSLRCVGHEPAFDRLVRRAVVVVAGDQVADDLSCPREFVASLSSQRGSASVRSRWARARPSAAAERASVPFCRARIARPTSELALPSCSARVIAPQRASRVRRTPVHAASRQELSVFSRDRTPTLPLKRSGGAPPTISRPCAYATEDQPDHDFGAGGIADGLGARHAGRVDEDHVRERGGKTGIRQDVCSLPARLKARSGSAGPRAAEPSAEHPARRREHDPPQVPRRREPRRSPCRRRVRRRRRRPLRRGPRPG